jgi:hypothetical protein
MPWVLAKGLLPGRAVPGRGMLDPSDAGAAGAAAACAAEVSTTGAVGADGADRSRGCFGDGDRARRGCRLLGRLDTIGLEGGTQLAGYRRFDAGGRSFDELAHFLEFLKGFLAVDAEFCCDLVHAWFCHSVLLVGPTPDQEKALIVDGSHFEPLISCPLVNQPVR